MGTLCPVLSPALSPFLLLVQVCIVLVVCLLVGWILRAETIVRILEILCDSHLDHIVLGDLESLLERCEAVLQNNFELLDKFHVLGIIQLTLSLVLNLDGLVVIHHTFADVAPFIFRIDLRTLPVCLLGLLCVAKLEIDVALDIVKGSIARLILLCIIEKGEKPVCVLAGSDVVVDQTDEATLVRRELGETFLEGRLHGLLAGCGRIELRHNVSKLGVDFAILEIVQRDALLEIVLRICIVADAP